METTKLPSAEGSDSVLMSLQSVSKVFTTDAVKTLALDNMDLEIRRGEYLAIAGPSGSGKSTLLAILGLLDVPSSGRCVLAGSEITSLSVNQRATLRNRHLGFVFQSFNLIGDLSVADNVALPLRYRKMPAAERKARVADALNKVGMSHRAQHYPNQLSGGQQQRAAVARAVVGEPDLLLADEPTGNLDSKNGEAVMQLLEDLNRAGSTICMVTHNPEHARAAGRCIHMFDGRLVSQDGATAGPELLASVAS
ncbi:MAG: ABC transporter ATP-binding protein [Myxococcota bacterium]